MIAIVIVLVSVTPVVISAMINWRKSKKTPAQELMEEAPIVTWGRSADRR